MEVPDKINDKKKKKIIIIIKRQREDKQNKIYIQLEVCTDMVCLQSVQEVS